MVSGKNGGKGQFKTGIWIAQRVVFVEKLVMTKAVIHKYTPNRWCYDPA